MFSILTYLDDPLESDFLDTELPFLYTKDVCDGLPTPSNIWMPIKDEITSASESRIFFILYRYRGSLPNATFGSGKKSH